MIPVLNNTGRVFEIYSIGDGVYMQRILNSVASLSNSGLLVQLVAFSLVLGLLVMGVKNVMAGGNKLDLGTTFICFIFGIFMFGLTANVAVYDMSYSPGEKIQGDFTVNNVPFGVAAAGWIISGVGYNLTEQMEQGFSIPGMENMKMYQGGFGKTLEWISAVRMWEVPVEAIPNGGGIALEQWKQDLTTYITDCTIPGIELGHISLSGIRNAEDPLTMHDFATKQGGIGYQSVYFNTELSGQTGPLTCAAAFPNLVAKKGGGYDAFVRALTFKMLENGGTQGTQQTLNDAYRSIGFSQEDVMKLMLSASVGTSLQFALENGEAQQSLSAANKVMIEQATAQRAVQWAAEETMFRRIMRPMMAFFESLLYALSPFMALAIGLGAFGIQTVFRYMMLAIWVALWMPMLSIIQLYQITAMQHAVEGMINGMDGVGMASTSIAGAELIRSQSMEWLASGAALAAWTPAITMALVWSGSVTASALAGKLQGSDTINEKLSAPDVTNTPAAINHGGLSNFNGMQGASRVGSEGMLPGVSFRSSNSAQVSSQHQQMEQAQAQYTAAMNRSLSHSDRSSAGWERFSQAQTSGDISFTKGGNVVRTPMDFFNAISDAAGLSTDQRNSITSTLGLGAGGGGSGASPKGGGGIGAVLQAVLRAGHGEEANLGTTTGNRLANELMSRAGISVQMSDQWANRLSQQASSGAKVSRSGVEEDAAQRSKEVRDSWSKMQSSSESYNSARSEARESGSQQSFDANSLANYADRRDGGGVVAAVNAATAAALDRLNPADRAKAESAIESMKTLATSEYGKSSGGADMVAKSLFLNGHMDTAIGGNIASTSSDRINMLESALNQNEHPGSFLGAGAKPSAYSNSGVGGENLPQQVDAKRGAIGAQVSSGSAAVEGEARSAPSVESPGALMARAPDAQGRAQEVGASYAAPIMAEAYEQAADAAEQYNAANPQGHDAANWVRENLGEGNTRSRVGVNPMMVDSDGNVSRMNAKVGWMSTGQNINQLSEPMQKEVNSLMENNGYSREMATVIAAKRTDAGTFSNDLAAAQYAWEGMSEDQRTETLRVENQYSGRQAEQVDRLRHKAAEERAKGEAEGPGDHFSELGAAPKPGGQ